MLAIEIKSCSLAFSRGCDKANGLAGLLYVALPTQLRRLLAAVFQFLLHRIKSNCYGYAEAMKFHSIEMLCYRNGGLY